MVVPPNIGFSIGPTIHFGVCSRWTTMMVVKICFWLSAKARRSPLFYTSIMNNLACFQVKFFWYFPENSNPKLLPFITPKFCCENPLGANLELGRRPFLLHVAGLAGGLVTFGTSQWTFHGSSGHLGCWLLLRRLASKKIMSTPRSWTRSMGRMVGMFTYRFYHKNPAEWIVCK